MVKDYSQEVKKLILKHVSKGFEFGKPTSYLFYRNRGLTEEIVFKELKLGDNLEYVKKENVEGETRYTLYFIHKKSKGRAYCITFRDKIRIITIFPLGRKTLNKYNKKRFKKCRSVN